MRRAILVALAVAGLLLPAALLRAGDTIPTDKQKKPPKKVITEDDLRSAGRPTRGTVSVGTPDAPADPAAAKEGSEGAKAGEAKAEAKPEPTESEKREAQQKEIQAEIDFQAANIKTLQEQVEKAQTELNDLTDLTFAPEGTATGRRTALLKLIDDGKAQIAASRAVIDQLQAKARQAGVRVTVP